MALVSLVEKDRVNKTAKSVYDKFEEDAGKVPEWVKVMAHRPEIVKEFTELFKTIMGKGEIERLLKWKIAYKISHTLKCPFCVDATDKMLKQFGATDETINNIQKSENLPEAEREILELVRDVTLDAHLDQPDLFQKLKGRFSEAAIVEIVSVIGLFNYINRFNNTLAVLPE